MAINFQTQNDILYGMRVVVVDDEPDGLYLVQLLLETYGAEVLTALNGEEALEVIRQAQPHFVVADIMMPKMDGREMVRRLKEDPEVADIPVIALSAGSMLEDRGQALAVGFHNYLMKPLRPERFVNDLLNMLVDVPSIAQALGV